MRAKIENIEILKRFNKEILLDWSNDRHQIVSLINEDADGLIFALEELVQILRIEKHNGEI